MRRVRNAEGKRIFRINEFLSSFQLFLQIGLKKEEDSCCDQMVGEKDLEAENDLDNLEAWPFY